MRLGVGPVGARWVHAATAMQGMWRRFLAVLKLSFVIYDEPRLSTRDHLKQLGEESFSPLMRFFFLVMGAKMRR